MRVSFGRDPIGVEHEKLYVEAWDDHVGGIPVESLDDMFVEALRRKEKDGDKSMLTAIELSTFWKGDGRMIYAFLPRSAYGEKPVLYRNGYSYWPSAKMRGDFVDIEVCLRYEHYSEDELKEAIETVKEWQAYMRAKVKRENEAS